MMHFPPVSDFPPILEKFVTFWKISEILPFPDKISYFHPTKFLTTFIFSHRPQISKSPLFCLFYCISPLIRENLFFPLLFKISPLFSKNVTAFYILYVYFHPYFDHHEFMHHPMHLLDAPEFTTPQRPAEFRGIWVFSAVF